jgi:hypothetical protein
VEQFDLYVDEVAVTKSQRSRCRRKTSMLKFVYGRRSWNWRQLNLIYYILFFRLYNILFI